MNVFSNPEVNPPLNPNRKEGTMEDENIPPELEERRRNIHFVLNQIEKLRSAVLFIVNSIDELYSARGAELEDLRERIVRLSSTIRLQLTEIEATPYGWEALNRSGISEIMENRPAKIDSDELRLSFRKLINKIEEDKSEIDKNIVEFLSTSN